MPVLSNVLISTSRSSFSSGVTSTANKPILQGIAANIMPLAGTNYKVLPEAALQSEYRLQVDSGVDVREGDVLTSITLGDGVTPWPGINTTNTNEYFRVSYVVESSPGPLAHRSAYVERVRGGGPVY